MIQHYMALQQAVDRISDRIRVRYGSNLVCQEGCSSCCRHHLSVFPVEAAVIREVLDSLPYGTREVVRRQAWKVLEEETAACPLLIEQRCAIYPSRPIICRTHGLPLLLEAEDGTLEVDFCPMNFSLPGAIGNLDQSHMIPLEEINLALARLNLEHCARMEYEGNAAERISIGRIILDC